MPKVLPEYRAIARSRILESAKTMFRKYGFRQTTMDEIAGELGISKAALYTYFKSKEELFKAAYESSPRELGKMIDWVMSQEDARKGFLSFFDEVMPSSRDSSSLNFEVISEAARNPELRKVLKTHYDQYVEAVRRCVDGTSSQKGSDSRELAGSITALWCGMETLVVLGFPLSEVRSFWKVAMEKLLVS